MTPGSSTVPPALTPTAGTNTKAAATGSVLDALLHSRLVTADHPFLLPVCEYPHCEAVFARMVPRRGHGRDGGPRLARLGDAQGRRRRIPRLLPAPRPARRGRQAGAGRTRGIGARIGGALHGPAAAGREALLRRRRAGCAEKGLSCGQVRGARRPVRYGPGERLVRAVHGRAARPQGRLGCLASGTDGRGTRSAGLRHRRRRGPGRMAPARNKTK